VGQWQSVSGSSMNCNRSGWTFHSLEDISPTDTADSSSSANKIDSMSRPFDQLSKNDTSYAQLSDLVDNFHTDGFLTLSSLLTPQFTSGLHNECMDIFNGVLHWLLLRGDVEFSSSYRKQQNTSTSIDQNQATECTSPSATAVYEYPLGIGLKNGYKELVMRSPGRYEMALLIDELPQHYHNRLCEQQENELAERLDETAADYEGKCLMNIKLLDTIKADQCIHTSTNDIDDSNKSNGSYCNEKKEEKSNLKQLLEWIKHSSNRSSSTNDGSGNSIEQHGQQYPIDEASVARFMELVGAIYPSSSSTSTATASDSKADNDNDISASTYEHTDNNTQQHQDDYYICNLSLLVATPGCPTQSWHADGGHTSLTKHEPCHVFNVFIPLVDVPLSMGPTELRPGTHYHTRNLTSMMLVAKARKTLRSPVTPELKMGDALIFDYRILHRGRANMSDVVATQDSATDNDDDVIKSTSIDEEGSADDECGRHRPVLVITFARRWFVDVCNFPKRSIFHVEDER